MTNLNDLAGPMIIAGTTIGVAVVSSLVVAAFKLGGVVSGLSDVKESIQHIHTDIHDLGKQLRGRFDRLDERLDDHIDRK